MASWETVNLLSLGMGKSPGKLLPSAFGFRQQFSMTSKEFLLDILKKIKVHNKTVTYWLLRQQ